MNPFKLWDMLPVWIRSILFLPLGGFLGFFLTGIIVALSEIIYRDLFLPFKFLEVIYINALSWTLINALSFRLRPEGLKEKYVMGFWAVLCTIIWVTAWSDPERYPTWKLLSGIGGSVLGFWLSTAESGFFKTKS